MDDSGKIDVQLSVTNREGITFKTSLGRISLQTIFEREFEDIGNDPAWLDKALHKMRPSFERVLKESQWHERD
jgi:hypothetical protein